MHNNYLFLFSIFCSWKFLDQRLLIKLIVDGFVHSPVVVWASVTNRPHIIILTPHDWWVLYVRIVKNLGKKKVSPAAQFTNVPILFSIANSTPGQCQMAANEHNGNMCNLFDECSHLIFGEIYFRIAGGRTCGLHMDEDENTQEPIAHSELTGLSWLLLQIALAKHYFFGFCKRSLEMGLFRIYWYSADNLNCKSIRNLQLIEALDGGQNSDNISCFRDTCICKQT